MDDDEKTLVQRSGQLMYQLSTIYPAISGALPEWSWDLAHDSTSDSLPYIGLHRNFPRHLFALGHGRHHAGAFGGLARGASSCSGCSRKRPKKATSSSVSAASSSNQRHYPRWSNKSPTAVCDPYRLPLSESRKGHGQVYHCFAAGG